ncbi:PucR family transcriptional regulator [Brevibacillus fluminis]|uniref:PucR family transcriptional regulator n=1 Tax=Brevibacillus fluminis TaxID=511487 RepID=UPI003F89E419
MSDMTVTLDEALKRPLFAHAEVVAGKSGLHRSVRWVHILEIPLFDETIIQGDELILSTGVGLPWGDISHTEFLQNLIDRKATCLCIELGHYFLTISDEMKALADAHHFPLIVFRQPVNFIEVTQVLHSLIINRQHQSLVKLDLISRTFHTLSLTSRATSGIIKELQHHTGAQVVFLPVQDSPFFFPRTQPQQEAAWLKAIHNHRAALPVANAADEPLQWLEPDETTFLLHPIVALEQTFGLIGLIISRRAADRFDSLILDRAATSLAHDFLRKHYIEEKKAQSEAAWLEDLIHGRHTNEEDVRQFVSRTVKRPAARNYRIVLLELEEAALPDHQERPDKGDSLRIHLALQIRFAFLSQLFQPFISMRAQQIIVLALDVGAPEHATSRLKKAVETLTEPSRYASFGFAHAYAGIGRMKQSFLQASESYREAVQMLRIRRLLDRPVSPFYEEAGIYRLLLLIEKEAATVSFVEDTLAPLLAYDRAKGTELLKTLEVYLAEDGSKQNTAQKLFIVRQTLYHRLEKMKELLGHDFMAPDKRLALEVALRVYALGKRQ